MLIRKIIALGALLIAFSSCNNKQPFQIDFEIAPGIVIGQENCSSFPSKNAWLIQLTGPSVGAGNRTFGDEITYNNIKYSNVVKTYNPPDTFKTPGKRYSFHFYPETNSINQQCDVQNPTTFNILNIRIKDISYIVD